jgi:NhaA family Na+:H+ antiporter
MEIKRELVIGELASPARLVVPIAAALGGMLVPIALFLLLAQGADARVGWGIPMATDIAFALGVIALVGRRAPTGLVALLLAIAIFDDIGSVLVIAVFYTETLDLQALSIAIGLLGLVVVMRQSGIRAVTLYALVGVAAWAAVLASGVHPTLVGVTLGLMTPWKSWYDTAGFTEVAAGILDRFRLGLMSPSAALGREQQRDALLTLSDLSRESVAPLDRLEHELHPWVAFGVVPLFAWANAGVSLGGGALAAALDSSLTMAVMLALLLGKPAGIVLGAAIALRAGARRPFGVTRRGLLGIAVLGGIGFTVSLFVTEQAFQDPALLSQAKMGVLAASLLSGAGGYLILRLGRVPGGRAS